MDVKLLTDLVIFRWHIYFFQFLSISSRKYNQNDKTIITNMNNFLATSFTLRIFEWRSWFFFQTLVNIQSKLIHLTGISTSHRVRFSHVFLMTYPIIPLWPRSGTLCRQMVPRSNWMLCNNSVVVLGVIIFDVIIFWLRNLSTALHATFILFTILLIIIIIAEFCVCDSITSCLSGWRDQVEIRNRGRF